MTVDPAPDAIHMEDQAPSIACPACYTRGSYSKLGCPECGGQGYIPTIEYVDEDIAVDGAVQCDLCNGTGWIPDAWMGLGSTVSPECQPSVMQGDLVPDIPF